MGVCVCVCVITSPAPSEMWHHEDRAPEDGSGGRDAPPVGPGSGLAVAPPTSTWQEPVRSLGGTAAQPPLGETHDSPRTSHWNWGAKGAWVSTWTIIHCRGVNIKGVCRLQVAFYLCWSKLRCNSGIFLSDGSGKKQVMVVKTPSSGTNLNRLPSMTIISWMSWYLCAHQV